MGTIQIGQILVAGNNIHMTTHIPDDTKQRFSIT